MFLYRRLLSQNIRRYNTIMSSSIKIGTHSGEFHADEALAVYLLRYLPEYKEAALVRTRNLDILKTCDIVVDVGAVYDHNAKRYDHHQKEFQGTYSEDYKTRLSSAGLVYKIIAQYLSISESDAKIPVLVKKLYDSFIEGMDGIDNGVEQYEAVNGGRVRQRYAENTRLSYRIKRLNPEWNEPITDEIRDKKFEIASTLAGTEFFAALEHATKSWLPARDIVVKALDARKSVAGGDPKGRILVLEETFAPWQEHLHNLEEERKLSEDEKPLYVIFNDGEQWRVQAVPLAPGLFASRKALPSAWQGLRDAKLCEVNGIKGSTFVHASGFTGGNLTREGIFEMTKAAIEA